MQTYVAMLRGINVSGQKKIKMAELKIHFENAGFSDVQTYIQSGNIVFKSELTDSNEIETKIESMIMDEYGFDVPCVVRTNKNFEHVLKKNPFLNGRNENPDVCGFTFLKSEPDQERIELLSTYNYAPEEYVLDGLFLYFFYPNGAGKAKMSNNFFEQKLKVKATSRNYKTTKVLFEMSK